MCGNEARVRPDIEIIIAANELVRRISKCETIDSMQKIMASHKAFEERFKNKKGCYKYLNDIIDLMNARTNLINLKMSKVQ